MLRTCFSDCVRSHSRLRLESPLALAVPSFVLLEPGTVDEPMGGVPVVLDLCGLPRSWWRNSAASLTFNYAPVEKIDSCPKNSAM
jgi:hypothetical protein